MSDLYYYDEDAAERAVEFFPRYLTHIKGSKAGQPFVLDDWQADRIVRPLFGWKRKSDGLRRYRTVYLEVPRKNGKTTLLSGCATLLLLADGEAGSEVISAAASRDQAALSFDISKAMIQNSRALRSRTKLYRRSITVPATNSIYKVIAADGDLAHGTNPHAALIDELHVHKSRDLLDALRTGMGAREQPVEMIATTAGLFSPSSIGWQTHQYAVGVADGTIQDDTFLSVIYAADPTDDFTSPETWAKANPGLGNSIREDYLAKEAARAKAEPSSTNTFLRLHLNIWTQQSTRWLSMDDWMASKAELPDLSGRVAYGGLDLASVQDLSCFCLIIPVDGVLWLLPTFWLPEDRVAKASADRLPYAEYARAGYLRLTPGAVTDYEVIRRDINALATQFELKETRFDRWNSSMLVNALTEQDGLNMASIGMGTASLSQPSKEFERLLVGGTIRHAGNPIMDAHAANVEVEYDAAGNIKPSRKRSSQKIDGIMAAVMATSAYSADVQPTSVYETRGLLTLAA